MKKIRTHLLGSILAIVLSVVTIVPAAYAALDITIAITLFGGAYVVDLFQSQLNDAINYTNSSNGVASKESSKIVPIVNAEDGTFIGAAQVTGPYAQVVKVLSVAQIEGDFYGSVQAKALIPLDSKTPLQGMRRVDQVGVSAILDISADYSPIVTTTPTPSTPSLILPTQPQYPAQVNTEQAALQKYPALSYALFTSDDIEVRGSNVRLLGNIRSNDDIFLTGNNINVSGSVMAHDDVTGDNNKGFYSWSSGDKKSIQINVSSLSTPSMSWTEMQRKAVRSYKGDTTMNGNNTLIGVTSVEGNLVLDGWLQGGGLLVVHGDVIITRKGTGAPDGLLIWTDGNVRMADSNCDVHASIITSKDITISGSNIRVVGNLLGRDITISGSNIDVIAISTALTYFPR